MYAKTKKIVRQYIGKDIQDFMELPNLVDIQLSSYESFIQKERLDKGEPLENKGLQEVFTSSFPIESPDGDMSLEYEFYTLDYDNIKLSELECKKKGLTYSVPLKARINLNFIKTGAILQKDIYMGDIPLMTDRGTFVINGAERVVVSQIHRSPGVIFQHENGVYSSRIIPYHGSWLEFEIDQKKELIYAKIDRKKKILGTIFLRALGYATREDIIDAFYTTEVLAVPAEAEARDGLVGRVLARAVMVKDAESGEEKKLFRAGDKLHPHDIDDLVSNGIHEITVIQLNARKNPDDKDEVRRVVNALLDKERYDHSGLIYGYGHAVYTISDPRAELIRKLCYDLAVEQDCLESFNFYKLFEDTVHEVTLERKGKALPTNVDFYSGFAYKLLGIPEELFTPLFAIARVSGWVAHNVENLMYDGRIMRPASKYVGDILDFVEMDKRR